MQGSSIRFLLKLLKIELDKGTSATHIQTVAGEATGHISDGIKGVLGIGDSAYNYTKLRRFALRHLSPMLDKRPIQHDFTDAIEAMQLCEAETTEEVVCQPSHSVRQRIRSADTNGSIYSTDQMIVQSVL